MIKRLKTYFRSKDQLANDLALRYVESQRYQGLLFHAWRTIAQQQKGLKRLSAKLKRLKAQEKGPWKVRKAACLSDGYVLDSGDFTHDVTIRVYGDFATPEQKRAYMLEIARRLNAHNQHEVKQDE